MPKTRSNISCIKATVIAGKAKIISKDTIKVIQVKTGNRIIFMPGARILIIVTIKFREAEREATPKICRPMIQKSVPAPVNSVPVIGAYPNQPIAGTKSFLPAVAPEAVNNPNISKACKIQPKLITKAPATKAHKLKALILGKATSRAPICKGTKKLKNAAFKGIIAKKIIVVPCIVNN